MTDQPRPPAELEARVAALMHARPVAWEPARGGYSPAERWVVRFADGRSAFAKLATTALTTEALRTEALVYERISGDFLPVVLGWDEGSADFYGKVPEDPIDAAEAPLLLLEDLSAAHWPPPWDDARVRQVLAALERVAATPPPEELPDLAQRRYSLASWAHLAADREPFLALGLCSPEWLERALPVLLDADRTAKLEGTSLVHFDVRSDNLCFVGERVVLVDWSWAAIGNPRLDVAAWLPSLAAEGGPAPETVLPAEGELAALMAGFWAYRAGQPDPWPGSRVRTIQRRVLGVALPWAVRALGLPPLDGITRDMR